MSYTPKILAFAGALRKDSTNKKMVRIAAEGAKKGGADVTYIDLLGYPLPLYDGDIETESGLPENALILQSLLAEHDGFLIASPEYNSSISGVLKNMIDWTSRPTDKLEAGACWGGKVVSIMSASPGSLGGLRGLFDVRKILSTMGVFVLPRDFALGKSFEVFDEEANLFDEILHNNVESLGTQLTEMLVRLNGD